MITLLAAQLFFGLDPNVMSTQQAIRSLEAQNFEQITKPKPPPSGASTAQLMDGLETEIKWLGFRSYDFRLRPRSPQSEIAYVDLHPCPSTGKLAEVQIVYKKPTPIAQFGEMTSTITKSLRLEPQTDSSGESLNVSWKKSGSSTVVAHWIKGGSPSIQLLGSRESLTCRLSFDAVAGPND
jgi:hypothetical protein